ncbi:MAG: DUF1846 family protein [Candidatus ainarchaeum sp.]|nr:DUF1846 family protein [Candidatus ainarchaeum sp.]
MEKAFDNKKYLKKEYFELKKRMKQFEKNYIEIGGHLLRDEHAKRVLPGYDTKNKLKLIKKLKNTGFVYCINANTLDKGKTWGNTTKTIEEISLREIELLKKEGLELLCIVLSLFNNKKKSVLFKKKIEKKGYFVLTTKKIVGYPKNLRNLFGKNGFITQPFLETNKKNIIVTGVGANSGKLFFCLSQIFYLTKKNVNAGYIKIETFPVWNLPLKHEVNLAYEAATADIQDKLVLDNFHKKKYKINSVNYNRDIEAFSVLKKVIFKITSKKNSMRNYFSPTDMGINFIKNGFINGKKIRIASRKEIFRRKKNFSKKFLKKQVGKKTIKRMEEIIKKLE